VAIWAWVLIGVAVVVLVAALAVAMSKRRTTALRDRFGPEYDRTIQTRDGRRAAESDLRSRQKQREQLTISPLPEPTRLRYVGQWQELQERFIDQPTSAVMEADALLQQVMGAEGYPMADFDAQADLVSVDHPRVVDNYRTAHSVYERARAEGASTEEMRTALLSYRSLFDELLAVPNGNGQQRPDDADATSYQGDRPHPGGRHYGDDRDPSTGGGQR